MNDWLKRMREQLSTLWKKWTAVQKVILTVIVIAVIVGIVLLVTFSSTPSMVPLLTSPVTDEEARNEISFRLNEEGVEHSISSEGIIYVKDRKTAQRMIGILAREDLIPPGTSPFAMFQMDRWTLTDFERDVNLREAIRKSLELHIKALDDIDDAEVSLVIPERALFTEDQNPTTASVIIFPRPGSGFTTNRKKIEGLVRLVKLAVEGLSDENIVITDHQGIQLNDFADLIDFDKQELIKRQQKIKRNVELIYKKTIMEELSRIFTQDRVSILNVDIEMDFDSKVVETEEHFPITMIADNPKTPYDETEVAPSITRSFETTDIYFKGTGFNPEGPPGQEGQTPPAYKDLDGQYGEYSDKSVMQNEEVNTRIINEETAGGMIKRITIGIAIDGIWNLVYDEKGALQFDPGGALAREYSPVDDEELKKAKTLVEHAIGFSRTRGDSVTVQHMQFDHTEKFKSEDGKYRSQKRVQQTILYSLIAVGVIVIAFVVFRLISREMERRRRLREEELSRQHQAMREAALRSAEEEGLEVQMSVEERARLEMQENAINMAREHPEDVAQLIRTWLIEE
ncbi:MAG: flagellar M-ring protein FliF [Spirochaetales bacterium]|nr:flagellar M-ring protein FliF [Spirochaetales bacterium]